MLRLFFPPHLPATWRWLKTGLLVLALALAVLLAIQAPRPGTVTGTAAKTGRSVAPPCLIAGLARPGLPRTGPAAAVPAADTSGVGMAAVWADVRRRSYFLDPAPHAGTWQAGNAAQRLTATLGANAYAVAAPLDSAARAQHRAPAWTVRLALRGIGRAGRVAFAPAAAAAATATDNTVAYAHGDAFALDYANGPDGLRQNYTLAQRPAGAGPVQVLLALTTALAVRPEGSQALTFATADGHSVLRYAGLKAWDATGRDLPAQLVLAANGHTLALSVDDAGATYPLTVDPIFSAPGDTKTGEATSNNFGYSVAGAGDVNGDGYADVIVGAPNNASTTGKAYVYWGSSTGLSATAPDTRVGEATGNAFGYSVAGAGDVNGDGYADVVVGAYAIASITGKAYVYYGSSTGLSATAPDTRVGEATNNYFGYSVVGAGDVNGDGYADVLVGAFYNTSSTGKAYVYYGSSAGLSATAPSIQAGEATSDSFGYSVAGAGDVNGDGYADVLVGAYANTSSTGKTYVYYGSPGLLAAAPPAGLAGTRVGETTSNNFGRSVAGAGDVNGDGYADIVVGASANTSSTGKMYVYYGSSTGLSATAPATRVGEATGNSFGWSVAGAGDVNGDGYADIVVGALNNTTNTGKAYVYYGSSAGLSATAPDTRAGEATNANFGRSVAEAGDVNGDGYADVLIGAYGNASNTGKTYVYLGNEGLSRAGGLRLLNKDLSTLLSVSNRPLTQFGIGLTARSTTGRVLARIVWETAANGKAFSHASPLANSTAYTGRGAWTNLPAATPTELTALVSKVGYTSRVRARLEYASASPLASSPAPNGTGGTGGQARYGPWTYVIAQQLSYMGATPLPVELTAFTAALAPDGASVHLAWGTASEHNSAAFGVERSPDGRAFAPLGAVPAVGNSTAAHVYAFADAHLPAGRAPLYYRLRLLDLDGTVTYSPLRTVARTGPAATAALSAYPLPAHDAVQVSGAAPGAALLLFDALGRPVATAATVATDAGTATLALPAGLAPGLYLLRNGSRTLHLAVE